MCMEDIRLGRELATEAILVPLISGQWVLVLGKDPNRTRVMVSGTNNDQLIVWFAESAPANTSQGGFYANANAGAFVGRVEEFGKVIQSNVWVFTPGIGGNAYVVSATLGRQ